MSPARLEPACADPEGVGQGAGGQNPHPRKNHRNIGFLSKTVPYPLKNNKAAKPVFNVGPSLAFCWRADDSSLLVVFGPFSLII